MGNPRRDGVDGRTEWARHGIRHHGRGVRQAEARLVENEVEGTLEAPRHKKKAKKYKPYRIQYFYGRSWHTASWYSYANLKDLKRALTSLEKRGFWFGWERVHPVEFRAIHRKTKEIYELE